MAQHPFSVLFRNKFCPKIPCRLNFAKIISHVLYNVTSLLSFPHRTKFLNPHLLHSSNQNHTFILSLRQFFQAVFLNFFSMFMAHAILAIL